MKLATRWSGLVGMTLAMFATYGGGKVSAEVIYINQVGYLPAAAKYCVVGGSGASEFEVVNKGSGQSVFTGSLTQEGGDFGSYKVGNFSAVTATGAYHIKVGGTTSYSFTISGNVYDNLLKKTMHFCREQRCGNTTVPSWHGPCHLDDAKRKDNGQHHDCAGGWHDAHNVGHYGGGMASQLLMGIAHIKEVLDPSWDTGEIINEIEWGNGFLHNIVAPEGYRYEHHHRGPIVEGNYWTDNIIGTSDDRILGTDPPHNDPGHDGRRLLAFDYHPWGFPGQFLFAAGQALCSRLPGMEANHAADCRNIAENCYNYCKPIFPHNSLTLGTYIYASIELYLATGNNTYKNEAVNKASELIGLQETSWHGGTGSGIRGFFYLDSAKDEVPEYITFWIEGYPLIALCRLCEVFPTDPSINTWKEALRKHTEDYLLRTSNWNAFGQIVKEIYLQSDQAGRTVGDLWYRYFFRHAYADFGDHHRQGTTAAVCVYAVGLTKASRILNNSELGALAQRQIDWQLGCNPVGTNGICSVTGFGYENFPPPRCARKTRYPQIDGGVANGVGGIHTSDMPADSSGNIYPYPRIASDEYWSVNEGTFQWALAELLAGGSPPPAPPTAGTERSDSDSDFIQSD